MCKGEMMKFKLLRKNTTLKADGKTLVFKDGVVEIKKATKDIEALVASKFIEEIKEDGKSNNS